MYAPDLDAVWCAVTDIEALPELTNIGLGQTTQLIAIMLKSLTSLVGQVTLFTPDASVGMRQKLCDTSRAQEWGWCAPTTTHWH